MALFDINNSYGLSFMKFNVTKKYDGRLLRDFIRSECRVSRKALCKLKERDDGILLNGGRVTVRAVIKDGDTVTLALEDTESDENPFVEAVGNMPPILYEDEALMVVDKPCGMPTHTSFGHYTDALSNAVCSYFSSKGQSFVFRAINRLDRDTSGCVLIAKNRYYANMLSKAMSSAQIKKSYIAITDGITPESGRIEGYISRESKSIIKRMLSDTPSDSSEYSLTEYDRIDASDGISLVRLNPITGRTHQLRLHLSSIGCPISGDTMYGFSSEEITRQALHAYSLSFPSPIDKREITVIAPLPIDMLIYADAHGLEVPSDLRRNR